MQCSVLLIYCCENSPCCNYHFNYHCNPGLIWQYGSHLLYLDAYKIALDSEHDSSLIHFFPFFLNFILHQQLILQFTEAMIPNQGHELMFERYKPFKLFLIHYFVELTKQCLCFNHWMHSCIPVKCVHMYLLKWPVSLWCIAVYVSICYCLLL